MEVLPIFASFLITEKLNIDNKKIADWCFKRPDLRDKTDLTFDEPELKELYSEVNGILNNLHNFLGFKTSTKQNMYEGWVNYNTLERTSVPHTHPEATFVCIYYPKVIGNVGYLELTNPNRIIEYAFMQTQKNSVIDNYNVFNSNLWTVEPKDNLLVIIPSWIQHYVRESEEGSTRLSIAINSKVS